MRRPSCPDCKSLIVICALLLLAGCDMHDKAWETEGDVRSKDVSTAPPSSGACDLSVIVSSNGTITSRMNGAALNPVSKRAIIRDEFLSSAGLLIVQDNKHDNETCFAVGFDLDSLDTAIDGRAILRHAHRNILIEADGPAKIELTTPRLQTIVDECCLFASDGDVDRLADRLILDPDVIDGRSSENGKTALMRASEMGRAAVVELLLNRKANTEVKDEQGRTALHLAVNRGRLDVIKRLVKHGADVNARTPTGDTPIRLAWKHDRPEIVDYLTGVGAAREGAAPTASPVRQPAHKNATRDYSN